MWKTKQKCVIAVHIRKIFFNKGIRRFAACLLCLCVIKIYSVSEDSFTSAVILIKTVSMGQTNVLNDCTAEFLLYEQR